MSAMPDFIIIGAMKCATSTLHEQLARQPGIFMSSPKEPCFFSDDDAYARGANWYSSLFIDAPQGALCGESSTHYTKLPTYPATIDRMRCHLNDDAKFIYIMRHPIDRLVSQYVHEWTQRVIATDINDAIDQHPELIAYSKYSMQIEPYVRTFGCERVLPMFFERLTAAPQVELTRAYSFIGHAGAATWDNTLKEQNVSSDRMRKSPARDLVINLPGLKLARQKLVPQSVRDRVKSLWMMKQRPIIAPENEIRLRGIFDEDLARLGQLLGLELTCDNFKQVARETSPVWREQPRVAAA